jgi:hypothetical protein
VDFWKDPRQGLSEVFIFEYGGIIASNKAEYFLGAVP